MHNVTDELNYTTDHKEIRHWAEERCGVPAFVLIKNNRLPIINFGTGGPFVMNVDWAEWFGLFEERNYALLCKLTRIDGKPSRFCQIVSREDKLIDEGK